MRIQPLLTAVCLMLCMQAHAAQAAHSGINMDPAGVVPLRDSSGAVSGNVTDFSEILNFMFFVQFLDRYYGVPTDVQDPIEVNPLSIVYETNDDPDAFDVAFFLD